MSLCHFVVYTNCFFFFFFHFHFILIKYSLDYPGVGPEHSFLKERGRAEYHSATDDEALEGMEIIPFEYFLYGCLRTFVCARDTYAGIVEYVYRRMNGLILKIISSGS